MVHSSAVLTFYTIFVVVTVYSRDTEGKSIGNKWYPKKYNHGIQRRAYAHWDDVGENHLTGNRRASADADAYNGYSDPRYERSYTDPRFDRTDVLQYKPWLRRKRSIPASGSSAIDIELKHHKKGGAKDAKHMKYHKAMLKKSHEIVRKGAMQDFSKTKSLKSLKLRSKGIQVVRKSRPLGPETTATGHPLATTESTYQESFDSTTGDLAKDVNSNTTVGKVEPSFTEVTETEIKNTAS